MVGLRVEMGTGEMCAQGTGVGAVKPFGFVVVDFVASGAEELEGVTVALRVGVSSGMSVEDFLEQTILMRDARRNGRVVIDMSDDGVEDRELGRKRVGMADVSILA